MRFLCLAFIAVLLCGLSCDPHATLVPEPEPRPVCESGGHSDVPIGECDLYRQDCGRDRACVALSRGGTFTTACQPTFGGKGIGQPCTGSGECDTSLVCANGACVPVCCPDTNDPCGDTGQCVGTERLGDHFARRCVFAEGCALFGAPCASGRGCYVVADGVLLCLDAGLGDDGSLCERGTDCAPQQMCVLHVDGVARCRNNCILDAPPQTAVGEGGCPTAQTCLFSAALLLPDGVGFCQP